MWGDGGAHLGSGGGGQGERGVFEGGGAILRVSHLTGGAFLLN